MLLRATSPANRPRVLLRLASALALVAATATVAAASQMTPPGLVRAKDFAILKRGDTFHIFYIRNDVGLPFDQTEKDFGHATSYDLYTWTQQPPVLSVSGGQWDNAHVWAPSIVEVGGVYYMLYTGVTNQPGVYSLRQRMGVATSTDLYNWNHMDAPVFSCVQVPWSVCDTLASAQPFRDPQVIPDPSNPGQWLMYYASAPASDPGGMMVGVARSTGNLLEWSDVKPLWITQRSYTYNDLVESPCVFQGNGYWYLFFTTNSGQPISFATGANPLGDPAEWTYRGRLSSMLHYDTSPWFASEVLEDGIHKYFCFVNGNRVDMREMVWLGSWPFVLTQPSFFRVRSMDWGAQTVHEKEVVNLTFKSVNWQGGLADIEAVEVDADGSERQIPPSKLELPDQIYMEDTLTVVPWTAIAIADTLDPDGDQAAELVVRLTDHTASTPVLRILPTGVDDPPPPPPPDPDPPPPDPVPIPRPHGAQPIQLRALQGTALGNGPAFLIELAAPTAVRLDLFDLQGRRLRNLVDRELPVGATVVAWDGRTRDGEAASPGIYFGRMVTPRGVRVARLLLQP